MTRPIEPNEVALLVDQFVDKTLADATKYDHCTPLDASNTYTLHELAAQVYALGFNAGETVAVMRMHRAQNRKAAA